MDYYHERNYSDALGQSNAALDINSGFVPAFKMLRAINGAVENYASSLDAYQKERQFSGNPKKDDPRRLMISAQVEAYRKLRDEALNSLKRSAAAPTVRNNLKAFGFEIAAANAPWAHPKKRLNGSNRQKRRARQILF